MGNRPGDARLGPADLFSRLWPHQFRDVGKTLMDVGGADLVQVDRLWHGSKPKETDSAACGHCWFAAL